MTEKIIPVSAREMINIICHRNLLDELPMIRNLCVKDVIMMYLQISLDVTEKRIPISARKMINIICHNVYANFVKATRVYTLLL